MKRAPRKRYGVHRTYPLLFWRLCCKCKQEFRREWGWKHTRSFAGPWNYLCTTCAPTIEDAYALRYIRYTGKPPQTGSGVQYAR